MKIYTMNWFMKLIMPNDVIGICLFPFGIFFRSKTTNEIDLRHEMIHYQQQKEMLCIFFYLWYIIEWLIKVTISPRQAYRNLSFEREAYLNAKDPNYLKTRKRFAWLKYIK
ncbi:MAG: hypothetical protein ACOXZV_00640 [Bacteroidales bacterium]|jgi:hypothetical protein